MQAIEEAAPDPSGNEDQPSPAFLGTIERWKRELLDLSGRNRAISYKRSRTSTLSITGTPEATWAQLLDGGAVNLLSKDPGADADNTVLTTRRAVIRRLAERARLAADEQGIQVLYAAFGWLSWFDEQKKEMTRSPLVLMPVELSGPDRATLTLLDGDGPEVNVALAELLRSQHGIRLPELDEESPSLADALAAVQDLIATPFSDWSVEPGDVVLDVFSFRKVALVREMERSLQRLWRHPLVRAFAGDASLLADVPALPVYRDLDAELPPDALATVVAADSSQLRAVAAAAHGASIVVQGPPGTGKSQTITNIIGNALAGEQTVLFVAEKAVARDVVHRNLEGAGLGAACLHIRAEAGSGARSAVRGDVLDEIRRAYEEGPIRLGAGREPAADVARLRDSLNQLDRALHAPAGADGWTTPFRVLGESLALPPAEGWQTAPIPPLGSVERRFVTEALEAVHRVEDLGPEWLALQATALTTLRQAPPDDTATAALGQALGVIQQLPALADGARTVLAPDEPIFAAWALDAISGLAAEAARLAEFQDVAGSFLRWLRPSYYSGRALAKAWMVRGRQPTAAGAAAAVLGPLIADARQAQALVAQFVTPGAAAESLGTAATRAAALQPLLGSMPHYRELRARLAALEPYGLRPIVEPLLVGPRAPGSFATAAGAALWRRWASELMAGLPTLDAEARARLIAQFRAADAQLAAHSRVEALNGARSQRPDPNAYVPPDSSLGRLHRAARLKRRPPLRRVLAESPDQVLKLKPCMLMSPLAVAQYLGSPSGSKYAFDLCIVDEASMVPTADMVVAMGLAKQVVVCGDAKQMPPTSYFDRMLLGADDDDAATDGGFESFLDEASALLPGVRLLWHYRSRDESLIAFSNARFYDGRLFTFPAPVANADSGVLFDYLPDAVYGRGGSRANPREAERVVELLIAELTRHPDREVGITAMSIAQQEEIEAALERASLDPVVSGWLASHHRPKNLETVQGDECDTMILSLGYGKDGTGRFIINFGPLAREGGERRLNVAVTRARWKTILVSSIRAADVPPDRATTAGAVALRDYLDYAERGPFAIAAAIRVNAGADTESPFEAAVLRELMARGLDCQPQVGVGVYRVDIGIRNPERQGEFALGVECDGAAYHSAPSARDRDILRQEVLERMGWRLHRVWSTAWYRDPGREADRVQAAYAAALAAAGPEVNAAAPPPPPPASPVADPSPATPVVGDAPFAPAPAQPTALDGRVAPWRERSSLHRRGNLAYESFARIAADLGAIIDECGPLAEADLFRHLRLAYGAARMGGRMNDAARGGLGVALGAGRVVLRNGFYWPADLDPAALLIRRPGVSQVRDPESVPIEEAARALVLTIEYAGPIGAAEAARIIKEQLRLPQVNERVRQLAAAAIDASLAAGWLIASREAGTLSLPR